MNLLTIGIDGGTRKILENMPMPFTHTLMSNADFPSVEEDLLSRGWAEILTGLHGSQTNALYKIPMANGTLQFSKNYSLRNLLANESVVPIWQLINEAGYSVGIMNIPTTSPAPQVDGFVVSGGGGGASATSGVESKMVFPAKDISVLKRHNYTPDIRLLTSGAATFGSLVDMIESAHESQIESFVTLCHNHQVDFGFFCFRITTELNYLAMYEIDEYINLRNDGSEVASNTKPKSAIQSDIERHYRHMDWCIERVFSALNPKQYMFCADHSTAPYRYEANIHPVLQDLGYLVPAKVTRAITREGYKKFVRLVPSDLKIAIKQKLGIALGIDTPRSSFDGNSTVAFGTYFDSGNFAGIYINDDERFSGPVSASKKATLVDRICQDLNRHPKLISYGINAEPYADIFEGARYRERLPDIRLKKPDDIYFTGIQPQFCMANESFRPLSTSLRGVVYPHSGVKGSHPLYFYSAGVSPNNQNDETGEKDLTQVYWKIAELMSIERTSN